MKGMYATAGFEPPHAYYTEMVIATARLQVLRRPLDPMQRLWLGEVLNEAGDRAGAEASYRSALELEPNLAAARFGLARLAAAAGRKAEGCGEVSLALKAAALPVENGYQRGVTRLEDRYAAEKLREGLCGKKKAGGATAPGRKTR